MNVYEQASLICGSCWILGCAGSAAHPFPTKTMITLGCSSMRSVFPRLFTRPLAACGKDMRISITRVFPSVSQVPSVLCPGVNGFHQLYSLGSVRRCSPVLSTQRVPTVPKIRKPTRLSALLSIDSPVEYTVRLTFCAAWLPFRKPGASRVCSTLLWYTCCCDTWHREHTTDLLSSVA